MACCNWVVGVGSWHWLQWHRQILTKCLCFKGVMGKNALLFLSLLVVLCLSGCQESPKTPRQSADELPSLVGCYRIEKQGSAQIKINQNDQSYTMQMKEAQGGWDTPEPMQLIDTGRAWEYFEVNSLGLHQSDLAQSLVREDGVLTLSVLKSGVSAINPNLDSEFVVSLFGASNTIYQSACDDEPLDIVPSQTLPNPHAM